MVLSLTNERDMTPIIQSKRLWTSETIYPKIHKLMTSSGITKTNLTDAIASSVIFDNTRVITS